jgi:hypothetical protein
MHIFDDVLTVLDYSIWNLDCGVYQYVVKFATFLVHIEQLLTGYYLSVTYNGLGKHIVDIPPETLVVYLKVNIPLFMLRHCLT